MGPCVASRHATENAGSSPPALSLPVCRLVSVETLANGVAYANYAHFTPEWAVAPPASPPPPPKQPPSPPPAVAGYVAEVAYLKTPLPTGVNFTAEVGLVDLRISAVGNAVLVDCGSLLAAEA